MKLPIVFFLAVFVFNKTVNAQDANNSFPVHLSVDTIPIDPEELHSIKSVEIAVLKPDTTVIGYISDTASKATFSLIPETSITGWLSEYTNSSYATSFSDTGKTIYWRIKSLSLSESISSSNVYIHLEAEVIIKGSNDSVSQTNIDTLLKSMHLNGQDYSAPFQNAMRLLTQLSASKSAQYNSTAKLSKLIIRSRSSMQSRDFSSLPIISDSVVNDGVFLTLGQFANNNPAVTQTIYMEKDTSSSSGWIKVFKMNADSSFQQITSLVAICINGELYAYRNHRLIALERTNNSMLISRYRDPDIRTNQAMYMRMILADSPGNENPFGIEYTCTTPGDEDVVATCIDLDTGNLSF